MPLVTKFNVTVGRKEGDKHFGSYHAEFSEEVVLEEGDDLETEKKAARNRCLKSARVAIALMKKQEE